ncbi:hypothetical protein GGR95_001236 [Sulfitobacter undariae]|uniref:Uncharacterized protein n=1 Tax=Sulfitobacter undariae TaxID=1563671 RepID=A0A7W6GZJ3_9RHOB|nr:hypothetical protein [Sulfitobacter undariae]MBB3993605.1 hypothetical protein [Sulfitobacter undariae]
MFDVIFALIAVTVAATGSEPATEPSSLDVPAVVDDAAPDLVAEPQTPTGKFTTATEVKPILTATKGNWIAVRDYGGNDLLYLTHLWSWRCGLVAVSVSINDAPAQEVPLPECHTEYATPNAILDQDGLPYLTFPQGSIENVTVGVTYDDLTRDSASFARGDVFIP